MKNVIKMAVSSIVVLTCLMVLMAQKPANKQTVYFFSKDLNQVGVFINKWSAMGYEVQSVTAQSHGGGYNSDGPFKGDVFVVMQK